MGSLWRKLGKEAEVEVAGRSGGSGSTFGSWENTKRGFFLDWEVWRGRKTRG
jgi:hypothetical protein